MPGPPQPLPDANEPHAGQWQFSSQEKDFIENTAATASYFEKAQYTVYERDAALQALLDNEIDFILTSQGFNPEEINQLSDHPDIHLGLPSFHGAQASSWSVGRD